MANLLAGVYTYDNSEKKLENVRTGQSILFRGGLGNGILDILYADAELNLPLRFKWNSTGSLTLDFSFQAEEAANPTYGLWRRLTFHLLDALPILFLRMTSRSPRTIIIGGWANGNWVKSSAIAVSTGRASSASLQAAELDYELAPLPQSKSPSRWLYYPTQALPDQFALRTELDRKSVV